MRGWDTVTVATVCSYDREHAIAVGDDVWVLEGPGWRKVYCYACGQARARGDYSLLERRPLAPLPSPFPAVVRVPEVTGTRNSGTLERVSEVAIRAGAEAAQRRAATHGEDFTPELPAEDDGDTTFDPSEWD